MSCRLPEEAKHCGRRGRGGEDCDGVLYDARRTSDWLGVVQALALALCVRNIRYVPYIMIDGELWYGGVLSPSLLQG